MCRVDPQAGEPGPCIVRARGALEHEKRHAHRHAVVATGLLMPDFDDSRWHRRSEEIPKPLRSRRNLTVLPDSDRPTLSIHYCEG